MKTIAFNNFLGINNRLPDYALRIATSQLNGQFLKEAVNVDIDNSGHLRTRKATARVQAMTGAHSLHMTSDTHGFLVRDSVLYAITLPTYSETLIHALTSNAPMSYAKFGDSIYCSNGTDAGRVLGGTWFHWAMAVPSAPALSVVGGALEPAQYQVRVSYYNDSTGEEGGASAATSRDLVSTGGIRLVLPASSSGATKVCVYVTRANGEVAYLHGLGNPGAIYDITTPPTGREAPARVEGPLPAGTVFVSNGRLCSFSGSTVYVGLPYRGGYYAPGEGYIPFPETVTVAVENQGGTYVCADKTYWIAGDIGAVEAPIREVLPYGAVPGTAFSMPDTTAKGWFGAMGVVLADTQGGVQTPMSDNVDMVPPAYGSSVVMLTQGYTRVVSCGWSLNLEHGGATNYTDWDFNSVSRGYGLLADGLYALEAEGVVSSYANLGRINFSVENNKRLPTCYLGVSCEVEMQLRVQTPDGDDYTYDARSSGPLDIQRVDVGRGLKANWFELTIQNQNGVAFDLASVSFAPTVSTRRI